MDTHDNPLAHKDFHSDNEKAGYDSEFPFTPAAAAASPSSSPTVGATHWACHSPAAGSAHRITDPYLPIESSNDPGGTSPAPAPANGRRPWPGPGPAASGTSSWPTMPFDATSPTRSSSEGQTTAERSVFGTPSLPPPPLLSIPPTRNPVRSVTAELSPPASAPAPFVGRAGSATYDPTPAPGAGAASPPSRQLSPRMFLCPTGRIAAASRVSPHERTSQTPPANGSGGSSPTVRQPSQGGAIAVAKNSATMTGAQILVHRSAPNSPVRDHYTDVLPPVADGGDIESLGAVGDGSRVPSRTGPSSSGATLGPGATTPTQKSRMWSDAISAAGGFAPGSGWETREPPAAPGGKDGPTVTVRPPNQPKADPGDAAQPKPRSFWRAAIETAAVRRASRDSNSGGPAVVGQAPPPERLKVGRAAAATAAAAAKAVALHGGAGRDTAPIGGASVDARSSSPLLGTALGGMAPATVATPPVKTPRGWLRRRTTGLATGTDGATTGDGLVPQSPGAGRASPGAQEAAAGGRPRLRNTSLLAGLASALSASPRQKQAPDVAALSQLPLGSSAAAAAAPITGASPLGTTRPIGGSTSEPSTPSPSQPSLSVRSRAGLLGGPGLGASVSAAAATLGTRSATRGPLRRPGEVATPSSAPSLDQGGSLNSNLQQPASPIAGSPDVRSKSVSDNLGQQQQQPSSLLAARLLGGGASGGASSGARPGSGPAGLLGPRLQGQWKRARTATASPELDVNSDAKVGRHVVLRPCSVTGAAGRAASGRPCSWGLSS